MHSSPDSRSEESSRNSYRELFERSADAILIFEGQTFVDCNAAAVKMLRCESKQQVLKTHPSELSPPTQPDGRDSYEKANEMIEIAYSKGSHRFEWDHKRADGEVFPVEVLVTSIQEPGHNTLHVVWRDITERKQLEEELRQALKMEAIGKLTGGIAHDFNNLLVSVIGYSDLLKEQVGEGTEAYEYASQIRLAGERAADLVRQLLAFGRKQQLLPIVLDLNELVRTLVVLIERQLGERIRLDLELAPGVLPIKADRSQVEQVLLNLAANAHDAMPGGGTLKIETAEVQLVPAHAGLPGDEPLGAHALLRFTDDGLGMDAETLERACEPFFTTKEAGAGTGLGLATVYGIVKQSRGGITLESTPGQGTVVEVQLPLTEESPLVALEPPQGTREESGRAATILVVDDEPTVLRLVRNSLEKHGYRVFACSDGREALAVYREHHREIELVLTDVIMPGLGGPELMAELKRLGHEPRVLFMSGYTDGGLSPLHEGAAPLETLEKPFDRKNLVSRVRQALS